MAGRQQPGGLASGSHAQALASLADAYVHAGGRNAQPLGDLLRGESARDQRQALALARRQAGDALGRRRNDVGHAGRLRESALMDSTTP